MSAVPFYNRSHVNKVDPIPNGSKHIRSVHSLKLNAAISFYPKSFLTKRITEYIIPIPGEKLSDKNHPCQDNSKN